MNSAASSPPHLPPELLTAVVLCGGKSRRLGRDKALLKLGGKTLIARVIETLRGLSEDVFIVSNHHRAYEKFGVRVEPDYHPPCGPLGGLAAALMAAANDLVIVTACDMPFLNPSFLRFLAAQARGIDAVVPLAEGQYEPLHAVYRRTCLSPIKRRLAGGDRQVFGFYSDIKLKVIKEAVWRELDPQGLSLTNINTAEDLKEWEKALGRHSDTT